MYISKVSIKNYRNLQDIEVTLKKFTLIIGENNIGKTNLLNAIGLVFSQDITFFKKRMLEIDDINYEAVERFKKEVSIWDGKSILTFPKVEVEIILTGFEENEKQEAIVADWFIDATFEEAKLTYQFDFRGDLNKWAHEYIGIDYKKIDFPIEKCEYSIFGGLDQTKNVDFYFLRMLKMEILDALRDAQKELIANNDTKLLYKILNNRNKSSFSDIKTQLEVLGNTVKEHQELNAIKNEIEQVLKKISLEQTENQNKVGFRFSSLEHTEILKKLSLEYGDNPISVERNGLGRNNVLFMSLVLSHLMSDAVKQQNVFFRIVGIEEPEAHLHPHLQEHLAKRIELEANGEMQIILTSHSTHITSKLDLENTLILYRHEQTKQIRSHYVLEGFEVKGAKGKIRDDAKSHKHKRYLSRYLDATKSTLLFGRKMILVEGISEQILIHRFFELYNKNPKKKTLESIGCSVVNVSSVAFKHFLELVMNSRTKNENFFVKCLVLTDSDSDTKNKERGINLKELYQDCPQILIKISQTSTFEKDIIESNKTGEGKNILLEAIEKTRPQKGKDYETQLGGNDINTESFFGLIEEDNKSYKADFATDLFDTLRNKPEAKFILPQYIKDGFDFILNIETQKNEDEAIAPPA